MDEQMMRRAIELARGGVGWVSPNPLVGAVVVKDGRILGEGWHQRCGGLHAERNALAACTEDPAGGTIYVTLEPCCHYGRTPPCTEAIIAAGLARVVYGSFDPNPRVCGKGAEQLRAAGSRSSRASSGTNAMRSTRFFSTILRRRPHLSRSSTP